MPHSQHAYTAIPSQQQHMQLASMHFIQSSSITHTHSSIQHRHSTTCTCNPSNSIHFSPLSLPDRCATTAAACRQAGRQACMGGSGRNAVFMYSCCCGYCLIYRARHKLVLYLNCMLGKQGAGSIPIVHSFFPFSFFRFLCICCMHMRLSVTTRFIRIHSFQLLFFVSIFLSMSFDYDKNKIINLTRQIWYQLMSHALLRNTYMMY